MIEHNPVSATEPRRVRVAVIGAGDRGQVYASWIKSNPTRAQLVAVADPLEYRRELVAGAEQDVQRFDTWQDLVAQPKVADLAIVATQDAHHSAPAIALAEAGYAVLLEKPIAPTEQECNDIIDAINRTGVMFGICHVLRYTPYTKMVKNAVDSGVLGQIMDIQHLEPVGWWHQAHSYVRGKWRQEETASPMLLAKSCHDIDWIRYIAGVPIEKIVSFGDLTHFTQANKPAAAGEALRCTDCALVNECPYSAPKIYLGAFDRDGYKWPTSVITEIPTREAIQDALESGPYGRCVYECDNDVVDHQSVMMQLQGGMQATFTMTAFSEQTHRQTRIFGSHGYLECDGENMRVLDFRTGEFKDSHIGDFGGSNAADGHGGGDAGLMDAFIQAIESESPELITSGARESLASHLAVFAAEKSRRDGTIHQVPVEPTRHASTTTITKE